MARETKAEKAAREAAAAEEERVQRERAAAQIADIEEAEQELGRPPTKDELAERRAARETADADRELEAEMGGHEGDGNGGGSIEERAANGGGERVGEEADGQLFVWEQGRKVTLGNLIPKGVDVENVFVFSGKRQRGTGQIMGFEEQGLLLVQFLSGGPNPVPTHDDDGKVKKVTIEQRVITRSVTAIESQPVEAITMLRPVLERLGYDIVEKPKTATG